MILVLLLPSVVLISIEAEPKPILWKFLDSVFGTNDGATLTSLDNFDTSRRDIASIPSMGYEEAIDLTQYWSGIGAEDDCNERPARSSITANIKS